MRKSMVMMLATALASCSLLGPGSPSDEQLAAADYGPRPSNDEIVLVAKRDALGHAVFKGIQAKDIQVVHSDPQTGWCGEKRRGFQFGWLVEVTATSGKAEMQKSYLLQQRPHGLGVLASRHRDLNFWVTFDAAKVDRELASTTPATKEVEKAEFGAQPVGVEKALREQILAALKDPESARIEFQAARPTWGRVVGQPDTVFGWEVTAMVNAKNSYGGYTGAKPWSFMLRDGRLLSTTRLGGGFELPPAAAPR
ncbi:MAG: hypothetical protein KF830_08625 [Planctomycetes bacterium]|nr:hypothetical protein [Planctomycetota bacterium]